MLWVAYAVGAAVVESALDVLRKKVVPPPLVTATFASAITALLGAVAVMIARPPVPSPFFLIVVLAAGGLGALIQPLYISAIRLAPLSVVVPYTSLTAVFVLAIGMAVGDALTVGGVAGVLMAAAGLFVLHADGRPGIRQTLRGASRSKGVRRMVTVAVLMAALATLDRIAVREGGILLTLALESLVTTTLLAMVLFGQGARPSTRTLGQVVPIGVLEFVLFVLVLSALAIAPAAYVVAVKRLWPLFSLLAGIFLFEEREGMTSRLIGGGFMIAGAVVIALFG